MSVALIADVVGARQHGAVHARQLIDGGATADEVRRAADRRELIHVAPEVYITAGAPRTWRQRLMVAVLDAGPGACVSHRAAAVLLAIARRGMKELVEITAPRTRSERIEGVIVHKPLDLDYSRDVVEIDGIPCTGPLRTLVDLGVSESWLEVWDAIERAIQAGIATHRGCEWMLARLSRQGRHGCGPFRRALDERALKMGAPHPGLLEPRMAGVLRRFGLKGFVYQYDVFGDRSVLIDFARPDVKVGVEVDGFEDHGNPKAMTKDYERDHWLEVEHGWFIIHFTWYMVVKRPKYVADQISKVLVARGGALRR